MNYAQRPNDALKVELLEHVDNPTSIDLTNLAALSMRYAGDKLMYPRIADIAMDWGYSPEELMVECREIWLKGY